jgi:hypothetical protein
VNPQAKITKLRQFFDMLMIATFATLLCLPALDYLFKLDHAPATVENRRPSSWPRFEGITLSAAFISGIEAYFNDHFGFRKQLVRWNNHWKGQLFKDASGRDVLIGREGWLFLASGRMFEHWTRQIRWSEQEMSAWARFLEQRRDWLRERGIKYIFVVPADKHTVYPEFLPEWMQKGSQPSKIEQLSAFMKAHSTVAVLDLAPALIEARKLHPSYLKTDTHWNLFGAFAGARALVAALRLQCPGLEPLPLDVYDWKTVPREGQDLARLMGRPEDYPETQALEPIAVKLLPMLKELRNPARLPQLGASDLYPCFTSNALATGKAIVFGDSFAKAWHPFLGQHFKEVLYVRYGDWDPAFIAREKPDVIIDEMVERGFNLRDPLVLTRKAEVSP